MFTKNPRLRGATTIAAYGYRITSLIAILCALPGIVSAAVSSPDILPRQPVNLFELSTAPDSPAMAVGIKAGEALFTGQRRFQNGGPPCATCHSVATLAFPSGGTVAPDLTPEYSKLGPGGMHYALRTLYFPAMNALFLKRQLTDQEERDLLAFFQNADSSRRLNSHTAIFGTAGVVGLLVLAGITWASGRGRVHSVRRKLLRRAGLYRENR